MKARIITIASLTVLVIAFNFSCTDKKGLLPNPPTPGAPTVALVKCDTISFAKHVLPFIISDCANCHYTGSGTKQGTNNYDFNTYAGFVAVGLTKIRGRAIIIHDMPKGSPNPEGLPPLKKAMLQCWLDAGGPNN